MAKVDYSGLETYMADLNKLNSELAVRGICKRSIYKGVEVLADGIRNQIKSTVTHANAKNGMTKAEQQALLKGLGTSNINSAQGDLSGKIGFDGYGDFPTAKWPKGVPIPLTARSLIKGTSWRVKADFVGPAVRKLKDKAVSAMDDEIEDAIKEKMKG